MDSLKLHYQKIKFEEKEKIQRRKLENDKRYQNNKIRVVSENEKFIRDTEEKEFKRYMSFYFFRKERLKNFRIRKNEKSNKIKAKTERLIELQKEDEEKNKIILKRIKKREKAKERYDEIKRNKFEADKKNQNEKIKKNLSLKMELFRLEKEKAFDIMDNQANIIKRENKSKILFTKNRSIEKKSLSFEKFEKNLKDFHKKMSFLKEQSIYKKTPQERFKIYKDLKKAEAERKKRELEEKLELLK